ncbi:MAG: hypothetical protein Solivirus4_32 [Solivirus sp.]|uniref:OTU domain-containing protein n=1 Tax=Solivirus sp. TaxID=2487772 RepID=A0A3G5AIE0_9VIRU|nr:MAG: hypothetical protein Solivirus4_32 [Solivirus sp.]
MSESVRRLNFETTEESPKMNRSPLSSLSASNITEKDVDKLVSSFEKGEMKKSPFKAAEEECVGDFCPVRKPVRTQEPLFKRERMTVDPGMASRFRAQEIIREKKATKSCSTDYWVGPYGVKVPNEITSIKASDGGNILYKDGKETEMFVKRPLTREQYLEKYAVYSEDCGYLYKIRTSSKSEEEANEVEEAVLKAERAKALLREEVREEREELKTKKIGLNDLKTLAAAGTTRATLDREERETLRRGDLPSIRTLARESESVIREASKTKPVEERLRKTAERVSELEQEKDLEREKEFYRNRSPLRQNQMKRSPERATLSRLRDDLAEEEELERTGDLTRARIGTLTGARDRSAQRERATLKNLNREIEEEETQTRLRARRDETEFEEQEEEKITSDYLSNLLSKIPPVKSTERYSIASLRDRLASTESKETQTKRSNDEDVDDKVSIASLRKRSPERDVLGLSERELQEARDLELARELQEEETREAEKTLLSREAYRRDEPKYSLKELRRTMQQREANEEEFEEFVLLDRNRTKLREDMNRRRSERRERSELPPMPTLPYEDVSSSSGRLPPIPPYDESDITISSSTGRLPPIPSISRLSELPPVSSSEYVGGLPSLSTKLPTISEVTETKVAKPTLQLATFLTDLESGPLHWTFTAKPIPASPNSEYIRVGAIGDGNCFFHAVCKGLADKYRQSYSIPDQVNEKYLQDLESYIGGIEFFTTATFTPLDPNIKKRSRTNPPTTEYQVNRMNLNNEMGRYRRAFVRKLREDMADNVIREERYKTIVTNNTQGRIALKLEELVVNLGINIEGLNLATTIKDVIQKEGYEYSDFYNPAVNNVLNEIVIDLRNMNPVEPFYSNILSDIIDADIYILRDKDLIKPPGSKSTPFYSGVSFHRNIRGPANMKGPNDYYYGLPDRRAIVIISYGDYHYELIGKQERPLGENNYIITTFFNQNEPLIQNLYGMLQELRKRAEE